MKSHLERKVYDKMIQVIEERTEALKRGEVESNKRTFLELLLELKEQHSLNDEDIRQEEDTFMFKGIIALLLLFKSVRKATTRPRQKWDGLCGV